MLQGFSVSDHVGFSNQIFRWNWRFQSNLQLLERRDLWESIIISRIKMLDWIMESRTARKLLVLFIHYRKRFQVIECTVVILKFQIWHYVVWLVCHHCHFVFLFKHHSKTWDLRVHRNHPCENILVVCRAEMNSHISSPCLETWTIFLSCWTNKWYFIIFIAYCRVSTVEAINDICIFFEMAQLGATW